MGEVSDPATTAADSSGWSQVPGILSDIVPPQFPDKDFSITNFGATSGLNADSAPALAAAIQACNAAGGGRVVVPAGQWLCDGPIRLLSNVNLYVEGGAIVTFGTDPKHYLPVQLTRWQGVRCYNYSPLIHAFQQTNIAVTGSGWFDGGGVPTWEEWNKKQDPDWALLQQMGQDGVPVEDRVFGDGHYLRPAMLEFYDCQNILVQGITLQNSPFWTMHPVFCTNVTIQEVTVLRGAKNDDGCDPDSCLNVWIAGCNFNTNDDNISIKAGLNPDATGLPACENIVVQGCTCTHSGWSGLTIGTQVGAYVRNVFMENCIVDKCVNAHYIKGHANWGGGVANIYFRSNQALTCQSVLCLQPDSEDETGTMGPPFFTNINMQDVTCADATEIGFFFQGDDRQPIVEVNLSNIVIGNVKNVDLITNTEELSATGIVANGMPVTIR